MTGDQWRRVDDLLRSALEREPSARASFLDQACAGDQPLREQVEALLAADHDASDFLERPAIEATGACLAGSYDLPAGRRIGAYRILRELGRGGMAAVYLAERADEQFRKQVAIKLVKRGMETDAILDRFRSERQILARLDHPHIAKLLDAGTTDDGLSYFIMEYVDGQPLDDHCNTHRLSARERLNLFRLVCSAVQHAQDHYVIHRDLKPSNILVTEAGVPKLLDFGIAKLLTPKSATERTNPTIVGVRPMTPAYSSPEQVRGEPVTPASDVYALGVLLYELLTGRPPYRVKGEMLAEVTRVICEHEPEKPSAVIGRRSLAGDLDNILLMALRKEPSRRYRNAAEFGDDLGRHLEGRPVLARRDTLGYRTAMFIKRNKAAVLSAFAAVIVTMAGVAISLVVSKVQGVSATVTPHVTSLAVLPLDNVSGDPEAHRLYLWGRHHFHKRTDEGFTAAIKYFERAIERAPTYAAAHAGLAATHLLSGAIVYDRIPTRDAVAQARPAALRALQLDDSLADAHAALAGVLMMGNWNWTRAEQAYRRAIELSPGNASIRQAFSLFLAQVGRLEEALGEGQRAVELDPLALIPNSHLAHLYYYARRFDEALEQTRTVLELDPNYYGRPSLVRGYVLSAKGMHHDAISEYERFRASPQGHGTYPLAMIGYARARSGDVRGAHSVLEEIRSIAKQRHVPAYHASIVYIGLGDREQAFAWLEKSFDAREPFCLWLKVDPLFDGLRSDSRFTDLVRRVGLP